MDLTVLHLAIPHLSADLQPTSVQLLWIVDIYGFLHAGSLVTMGTLGDRIGRRRLLLLGAAGFGVASVAAASASSAGMLIATRALLGVAGATLMPSALSLTTSMFHQPRQRTVAIGLIISSFSGGTALGPLLGGWVQGVAGPQLVQDLFEDGSVAAGAAGGFGEHPVAARRARGRRPGGVVAGRWWRRGRSRAGVPCR
jgi:MFS family permease